MASAAANDATNTAVVDNAVGENVVAEVGLDQPEDKKDGFADDGESTEELNEDENELAKDPNENGGENF